MTLRVDVGAGSFIDNEVVGPKQNASLGWRDNIPGLLIDYEVELDSQFKESFKLSDGNWKEFTPEGFFNLGISYEMLDHPLFSISGFLETTNGYTTYANYFDPELRFKSSLGGNLRGYLFEHLFGYIYTDLSANVNVGTKYGHLMLENGADANFDFGSSFWFTSSGYIYTGVGVSGKLYQLDQPELSWLATFNTAIRGVF